MLGNRDLGARVNKLQFNIHTRAHLYRAALEGIAFSFVYGMGILKEMGLNVQVMRVGNDNLFRSKIFSRTISNLLGSRIEMVETTGAVGAAKGAGVAVGVFFSIEEAMKNVEVISVVEPGNEWIAYEMAYRNWKEDLKL
jgi:xylulokinase